MTTGTNKKMRTPERTWKIAPKEKENKRKKKTGLTLAWLGTEFSLVIEVFGLFVGSDFCFLNKKIS
jgi:hypothetical protein